ncbi:MAG: DUF3472 domain-containing protein [Oscillospiraceae bacterium]|nr:DUF3472 domain-containing protein [Oscillospiraceae bacterium]
MHNKESSRNTDWEALFPIPSPGEIRAYRNPQKRRSPYLCGYLQVPRNVRYTEYQVDFRAGHLPRGTYCCLGCWAMDLSGLRRHYRSVPDMYTSAYAGFQRIDDGRTVSIMSFWDISCTDRSGRQITLRPKILYPDTQIGGGEFWGEGTGARCTAPYEWEAGHWYRMHLRCVNPPDVGTTYVEQWVRDLETGEKRLLCCYDTLIPNSAFLGNAAIFLENYLWETAGQVRSMEVRNPMYRREDTGKWHRITQVLLDPQDGPDHGLDPYIGSYDFGIQEDRIWMITCGAGGDWLHNGRGRKRNQYTIGKAQP